MDFKELREAEKKATPGPWMWDLRTCDQNVKIVTTHSGQYYVMGCERWGMRGAGLTFQRFEKYEGPVAERGGRGMTRCDMLAKSYPGKDHHEGWDDYIDHPDALILIEARNALPDLFKEIDRLAARIKELEAKT